jgi:uncharacterized OB-fold protein
MSAPVDAPAWAQPLFDGLGRQTLLLPRCRDCEESFFPPRPFCPACWSDEIEWRPSTGTGEIYTFCIVRAYAPSIHEHRLPFVIAIVRLDEGVQLLCNVEGPDDDLEIGDRVAVRLDGPGAWPLVFEPIGKPMTPGP